MTLEKLKVDPAIATGPFISITNDIIGMICIWASPYYWPETAKSKKNDEKSMK